MNRRRFLCSLTAVAGATSGAHAGDGWIHQDAAVAGRGNPRRLQCSGSSPAHRPDPEPDETLKTPVIIVGGGIAGLSAGWKLQQAGFTDFAILELESEVGGNARSGRTPSPPTPGARTIYRFPPRNPAPYANCWRISVCYRAIPNGGTRLRRAFHQLRAPGTAVRQRSLARWAMAASRRPTG